MYFWIFLFSVCFQYLYSSSSGACPLGNDANFFFRRKMELLTFWLFHQPCANIRTWVLPIEKYLNYGSLCSKSLGVGKELTPHPWAEQCWLTGKLHLQSPGVNTGSLNPVLWKQLGPMFTLNTVLFFPLFRACCFQAHVVSVLSAFCLVSVSSWQGYCHRHSLFAWLYFYVGEITSSACFAARCWDSWCGCSSVDVFQGILFFVTIILVLGCWCKGGGEGWMGWSTLSAFSSWCPLFLPVPPRIWKKKSEIIDKCCSDAFSFWNSLRANKEAVKMFSRSQSKVSISSLLSNSPLVSLRYVHWFQCFDEAGRALSWKVLSVSCQQ